MKEIVFENGDKATVPILDFDLTMELKNVILKQLKDANINLGNLFDEFDISKIVNFFINIDSSDEVLNVYKKCFNRCTYNGLKITDSIFEGKKGIEARKNYYAIIKELVVLNLSPFFEGLVSTLTKNLKLFMEKQAINNQK